MAKFTIGHGTVLSTDGEVAIADCRCMAEVLVGSGLDSSADAEVVIENGCRMSEFPVV